MASSMAFYGLLWPLLWPSMAFYGLFYGLLWPSMAFYGLLWPRIAIASPIFLWQWFGVVPGSAPSPSLSLYCVSRFIVFLALLYVDAPSARAYE